MLFFLPGKEKMKEIFISVVDELNNIVLGVFHSIRDDLLFTSPRPIPIEEQVSSKIKGQHRIIRSKQRELSALHTMLRESKEDKRSINEILERKKEELEKQRAHVKDLEQRLRDAFDRLQQRR
jgi:septal ring factor EnvC (AmiA/AmiB activator)